MMDAHCILVCLRVYMCQEIGSVTCTAENLPIDIKKKQ
jgi:hypothetical protein